jgi:hypothetical protein
MDHTERLEVPKTAERMTVAASAFLGALTAEQTERACYAFGDERRSWSFLPARDRDGCRSACSTRASAGWDTS